MPAAPPNPSMPRRWAAILKTAREHNPRTGVTGVLCHCATSKIFMQVLEGGRGAVSALYNRIAQDPRHREVALLSYEEIGERSFSAGPWARSA
jgi:hypothetical protein